MNKEIWKEPNSELPCPTCVSGVLQWQAKNTLQSETRQSLIANEHHRNGLVNPDCIYMGSTHLSCSKCKEVVVMVYKRTEDVRWTDEDGNEIPIIEPQGYFPALSIIGIPASCPNNIREQIVKSFSLFWIDLDSCGNKIRTVVEVLLDAFDVPRDNKSLHKRLKLFQPTQPQVVNYLMSIKWIGNSGSHMSGLTKDALIDAYELLEYSLELLYNDRQQRLDALSTKINTDKKHT